MNRRTLLIAGGALLAVVLVAGLLVFNYVQSLLAFEPLTISYATVQTNMPENAACAGGSGESTGIAKEIINLDTNFIYVAGGDQAMPDDVWADYNFRLPILQNSTRNLMFQGSCFFRSPGASATCTGEDCFIMEEINGYNWLALTLVEGQSCFPDAAGCSGDVVNPGYVSITTIAKCHRLVWEGPVIYELTDAEGNLYVMHATATGTPDLNPTLPDGWSLAERTLSEPLVLLPFGGGDECHYNVLRDNLLQSYHQYTYAAAQYPS
ncbi:MAG: hypothetical protein ACOYL5_10395 [Phototrophicaceae bacterium]